MNLPAGKLPSRLLRSFLSTLPADPSIVLGGAIGEDAAVIDTGGAELLVAKTDPITFATADIGRYLVAVNSNDLAVTGAEPRWLLMTALLPNEIEEEHAVAILRSVAEVCREAGISVVGGHTEITAGLDRPILVGCLLGTVPRDRLLRKAAARPGDVLLLAGGIAIEGTSILASEHSERLLQAGVDPDVIARASGWIRNPGISILPAARILRALPTVRSMHDPTEGGLVTALHELAEASQAGIRVNLSAVPVLPECRAICDALGLDALGLLASGALLATLDAGDAHRAIEQLAGAGIPAAIIGELVPPGEGDALPSFERDELARFLSG